MGGLPWFAAALIGSALVLRRPVPAPPAPTSAPYRNPDLPIAVRVNDLVSRMTLQEKLWQLLDDAPAIDRLGVPAYHWWNECLHGVARAGVATVFPQAIGLSATWDPELLHETAAAIGDEARAKHHEALRQGMHRQYFGLTFWSPNINLFRDPRWGRGQETYGEDPYLTGRMAVSFVRGLQGDDPHYLKVVATLKHFAVHSGPDPERHEFDARISEHDLRDTYLEAFRAGIVEGKAASVMAAANRLDGLPCCANPRLLRGILRQEWGFDGYVTSDCWSIGDVFSGHHVASSLSEAAALSLAAGTDLDCGGEPRTWWHAAGDGLVTGQQVDGALRRLFTARFRLGMFDPPQRVPYAHVPYRVNDCPDHRRLALRTAQESLVLLRNQGAVLPLPRSLRSVAVIGPDADAPAVLLGNYHGTPSRSVTPLQGIRTKLAGSGSVRYAQGCLRLQRKPELLSEAVAAARKSDVAILVLGLAPGLEDEENHTHAVGFDRGDRTSLDLPAAQDELLRAVAATGKPVVLVLMSGGCLGVNWAAEHVPAIVQAWYPGEEGGTAIADVLFGDANPSGRLPLTFYRSVSQLPPFRDYAMNGRTYRYFTGRPLYPFGYGLSYTRFRYGGLARGPARARIGQELHVRVEVRNAGDRDGAEVVQLYVRHLHASVPAPLRALQGVRKVHLRAGERRMATFVLTPRQLSLVDGAGARRELPGEIELSVGGVQPQPDSAPPESTQIVSQRITLVGEPELLSP